MPVPCKVPELVTSRKNCSGQLSISATCALGGATSASDALAPRMLTGA